MKRTGGDITRQKGTETNIRQTVSVLKLNAQKSINGTLHISRVRPTCAVQKIHRVIHVRGVLEHYFSVKMTRLKNEVHNVRAGDI